MATATTNWILELIDRVSGPINKVNAAMNAGTKTAHDLTSHIKVLEKQQSVLQKRMAKFTVGALAFYGMSRGALSFQDSMAKVNTMVSGSQDMFEKLKDGAMKLSTEVNFTRTEIGDGLYNTLSAGVPENNAIDFLTKSSKAAQAGVSDINTLVSATTSIVKNYGDSWENVGKIQDMLQATVKAGKFELGSLASAIPRVVTLSSQLNLSQQELLSTFATLSNSGAPSEIATQLQAALAAMMKPSAEAITMANKLGIAFDAKSIGRSGGLQNYINELIPRIQAFADKTGETQEQIIGKLFGSQEAIKMVMGLSGDLSETWALNTKSITNSIGYVDEAFSKNSGTINQKWQNSMNAAGNVITRVVEALTPLVTNLMDVGIAIANATVDFMDAYPTITKVVAIAGILIGVIYGLVTAIKLYRISQALANATGKLSVIGIVKQIAKIGIAIAGYALLGTLIVAKYVGGLIVATAAQLGLNVAMSANPIGLIIIGIFALIGVITLVVKYWDKLKIYLINFAKFFLKFSPFGFMIELLEKIFPGFKDKLKGIFDSVKKWLGGLWDIVKNIFNKIKEFFGFGEEAKVEVKYDEEGNPIVEESGDGKVETDGDGKNDGKTDGENTTLGNLLTPTGGGNSEIAGGGGTKKSIVMTLNVVNNFNVAAGRAREEMERIADEVVGRINDQMRDVVIADG